ncbi:MAG: AI-2E family transporter [Acidobacteriota bacterium]|nr:AI-2E family transporter [Acidobacteriota bacterium]
MPESKQPGPRAPASSGWLSREQALALVLMVATALAFYVCYRLALPFLPAITWALALAVVAHPLHETITRRVKSPNASAGLSVALVAVLIVTPGMFLIQQLVSQASRGAETLRAQAESGQLQAAMESHPQLSRALGWFGTKPDMRAAAEWVVNSAGPYLSSFVGGSLWTLAQLVITFFTLFYLLRDRRAILKAVRSLLPLSPPEADSIFARVGDTIHATVYGTFVVSSVQGVLGGLMFWWLGLPGPLLWGFVMFLLSLVPVLGAPVVWIPAAAFLALTGGWWKALVLAGWGVVVIGAIDNLLYPVLVGDRVRMHTLLVFFSVVGGLILFGSAGLVLGPVAVVVTTALVEVWRGRTAGGRAAEDAPKPLT